MEFEKIKAIIAEVLNVDENEITIKLTKSKEGDHLFVTTKQTNNTR